MYVSITMATIETVHKKKKKKLRLTTFDFFLPRIDVLVLPKHSKLFLENLMFLLKDEKLESSKFSKHCNKLEIGQ